MYVLGEGEIKSNQKAIFEVVSHNHLTWFILEVLLNYIIVLYMIPPIHKSLFHAGTINKL